MPAEARASPVKAVDFSGFIDMMLSELIRRRICPYARRNPAIAVDEGNTGVGGRCVVRLS